MSENHNHPSRRAVILLSGGLDSATTLAIARTAGFDCYCLSFDYGQRHRAELDAAVLVAKALDASEHRVMRLDLGQFGGSALTDNNITATQHPSGLRYVITQTGTGAKPNFSNIITVKYTGRLLTTGEVFDQAVNPVSFPLNSLIQAWQIAFPLLSKGSKATLYVPSGLGYGERGSGTSIPRNANLVFDVELIDFR